MASALKCDRCGRYYDYYGEEDKKRDEFAGKKIRINSISANHKTSQGTWSSDISVDLCPFCKDSFLMWWERWMIEPTEQSKLIAKGEPGPIGTA